MEKSITFVGAEHRELIRSGKITAYLILRNYEKELCRVGDALRLNVFNPTGEGVRCVAKTTVTKVLLCPLMQIPHLELLAAGYQSMTEAVDRLRMDYPNMISPNTDMVVISWKDVISQ